MNQPTVVLVDLHTSDLQFECDRDCVPAIIELLQIATKQHWDVVVVEMNPVEYPSRNPTLPEIMNELTQPAHYPFHTVVYKELDDGSEQILTACKSHGFRSERFIVCGLYAGCCVIGTAAGLGEKGALVEVYQAACNQDEPDAWKHYKGLKNVVLV